MSLKLVVSVQKSKELSILQKYKLGIHFWHFKAQAKLCSYSSYKTLVSQLRYFRTFFHVIDRAHRKQWFPTSLAS